MIVQQTGCKGRANSALIVGHVASGMGEKSLASKMQSLVGGCPIIDIETWMGERYATLAELNYALADGGHEMLQGIEELELPEADLTVLLSWSFSVAAFFATSASQGRKVAARLFAHHVDERVLPELYKPADLLLTEALLANERGEAYGIEPGKMLYIPHTYVEGTRKSRGDKRTIGVVSRLEYGKNVEFALDAVRQLVERGREVELVLMGDFPESSPYPDYQQRMREMMACYEQEGWLTWEKEWVSFPAVVEKYARFDVLLHPSGAEGGSHVVVECLGLGIPCVVLECSTNPYLFKDLATFVNTSGEICPAQLPFYCPDLNDLVDKLDKELKEPDLGRVAERFHPDVAAERIPLLFDPHPEKIAALTKKDRKLYGV